MELAANGEHHKNDLVHLFNYDIIYTNMFFTCVYCGVFVGHYATEEKLLCVLHKLLSALDLGGF